MTRKTVLTPRMEAEIALAEAARLYREATDALDEQRRAKVKAAEMVVAAERNLAKLVTMCDKTYALKADLFKKFQAAQDEFNKLESEFTNSVHAKLLTDQDRRHDTDCGVNDNRSCDCGVE